MEKLNSIISAISRFTAKIIDLIVVLMFSVLIVSCVTQVFMRSVLNASPPWTEELARYAFMYVNIIGAAICVRKNSSARVTALVDALPQKAAHILDIFAYLVIIFVSYIMIRYGMQCVLQVSSQHSPAMRLCMSFVYACIPLSGVFIAFEGVANLLRALGILKNEEVKS